MRWLSYFEPARLRGIWVALVGLLTALGVSVPAGWDGYATAVVAVAAIVVPLIQAELTRRAVYSPATADRLAAQDPDLADVHAGEGDLP
mgnify:CR=1 FL=1